MKLLVLGGTGLLGTWLVPHLRLEGHEVVAHGHAAGAQIAADLTRHAETLEAVAAAGAEVVVNLVGLTDVDGCEKNPQRAWQLNVLAAQNVAAACATCSAHLVHVSTDQVYDGAGPHPEDHALPGNYYAQGKYAGELAALRTAATVLRTNFFGASRHPSRRSLTDWLFDALRAGRPVPVFADVLFSPLSFATLCRTIGRVAALRPPGVFNLGSADGMSKADFAFEFARFLDLPAGTLRRASVEEVPLAAWRPRDMRMDSRRIGAILGADMPSLAEEIATAAKDYRDRF